MAKSSYSHQKPDILQSDNCTFYLNVGGEMDRVEYEARRAALIEQLRQYNSSEVYSLLTELGDRHTGGLLKLMAYSAQKPYHQLETVLMPTTPINNQDLAMIGSATHSAFPIIPEALRPLGHMLALITAEMACRGSNYTLVTNHSNVIDIALVLGACRLESEPWLPPEEFSERSTLVIGRGITTTKLAATGLPEMSAVEAIQLFANVVFSFPTTPTTRDRAFPDGLVSLSNRLTKLEVAWLQAQGGHLLAIAPSASHDLHWRKVHMQPLKRGTMQMMRGVVIPVAATLDPPIRSDQPPACTVLEPRPVRSDEDCHAIMLGNC